MKSKLLIIFLLILSVFAALTAYFSQSTILSLCAQPIGPYDVRVTNIRFLYGVGRGPTHSPPNYLPANYYRSYGIPGTIMEITSEMDLDNSGGTDWRSMYGNVKFTVTFTDPVNSGAFEITIPSGQNKGTGIIPYNNTTGFTDAWMTSGTTAAWTYRVTGIAGEFANTASFVSSSGLSIYWDRLDEPMDSDFPPSASSEILISSTTTSFKLLWNPLSPSTGSGLFNEDFYEYKIYYRADYESTWRLWNGSNDPTLRGLSNNPASPPADDSSLHFSGGRKYTTIPNLQIFSRYLYYIAASDVFGNETPEPSAPFELLTQPYSVKIIISDGIDTHRDFTDLSNPQSRSLRESNVKVDMYVVAAKTFPDALKVWYTYMTPGADIVAGDNTINQAGFSADSLFSSEARKSGPNQWTAYLSTQTPVIRAGNAVRFIVESTFAGVPVYSDFDLSDGDPNDDEWTLYIGIPAKFKPWPVRILNNVITNSRPIAYPSYYLSNDASVTIKVYDIKGRPVTTIIDGAFRRGGQNIKEEGWTGNNKARRKLGVGLYYMHFKAKRVSDGKIILNEAKKVVIAK